MATPILDRPDRNVDPTIVEPAGVQPATDLTEGGPTAADEAVAGRHRAPTRRELARERRTARRRARRQGRRARRTSTRPDEGAGTTQSGPGTTGTGAAPPYAPGSHTDLSTAIISSSTSRSGRRRDANPGRTSQAVAIAIVLIGLAVAVGWLGVAPLVFGDGTPGLDGPLAPIAEPEAGVAPLLDGVKVVGNLQISQPRDPFRPLVSADGSALTPAPGSGGSENGFEPSGITVRLLDIRDVGGVLRATVEVDGVTYEVGVGDTFAGSFQVVSLDSDSGVFLFGDNAFELQIGQEILK